MVTPVKPLTIVGLQECGELCAPTDTCIKDAVGRLFCVKTHEISTLEASNSLTSPLTAFVLGVIVGVVVFTIMKHIWGKRHNIRQWLNRVTEDAEIDEDTEQQQPQPPPYSTDAMQHVEAAYPKLTADAETADAVTV